MSNIKISNISQSQNIQKEKEPQMTSDEKAAEKYLDTKANSDNFDVQKAFIAGCQHARQGHREMLIEFCEFRYKRLSKAFEENNLNSAFKTDEEIIDEFLAEEAKREA